MRTRTRITLAGVVLGAALIGGVAWATIPTDAGVYTACKLNVTGTIRLIDPSLPTTSLLQHCTSLETQITWSQRGPAGPQGEKGAAGTNGANGAPGADGAAGPKGDPGPGLRWRGNFDNDLIYLVGDVVQSNGSAWVATAVTHADVPPAAPWELLASHGLQGPSGADGHNGADGANGTNGATGPKGDPCLSSDPACRGPQGAVGPQGPQGPQGAPGSAGNVLWARVGADGTLTGGSGVVSAGKLFPDLFGQYVVDFNRDITHCALTATALQGHAGQDGLTIDAANPFEPGAVGQVFVEVFRGYEDLTGFPKRVDAPFALVVTC